jgi:cystathionine beta-lyase family protein involved in aluminum resistance
LLTAARRAADALVVCERDRALRVGVCAKVYDAFFEEGVGEHDLAGTSGYGYHDTAREHFESLLARVFRAERALARLSLVSGTHAILIALGALARPGRRLISATGRPYDTLHNAIAEAPGSLVEQGICYEEVALDAAGRVDLSALAETLREAKLPKAEVIFVQRSRGYAPRPSLSLADVEGVVACVRRYAPDAVVAVDNCYCELVEEREPLEVGADLVMGSLIKNLGGGIAPTGGYVAGRAALVERVAARLYAPGLGASLGPTLGLGRLFFQGLFAAPGSVWEAIRGLNFAAALYAELGFEVDPLPGVARRDIVQTIRLGSRAALETFAHALQRVLPINARFRPEPGEVPGYREPVIMSEGSFIGGATIELSCDAPLREPYEIYLQGGLTAEHVVLGALVTAHAIHSLAPVPRRI